MPARSSSLLGRLALRLIHEPLRRWREACLPDEDVVVETGGLKMKVFSPRRNRIGRALYEQGVWEPEVTKWLRERGYHLTALDAGAISSHDATTFHAFVPGTRP